MRLSALAVLVLAVTVSPTPSLAAPPVQELRRGPLPPPLVSPFTQATARWCGTDAVASDRKPEAAGGLQVHVLYAVPSDGADSFATRAPAIVADLTALDGWWRGQDPARTPRFDLFPFPGCDSPLGQLDLSSVRLPRDSATYRVSGGEAIDRLSLDATGGPAALGDPRKKYLMYYDGPVLDTRLCGISYTSSGATARFGYAVVFLQSSCALDLGTGSLAAATAAHELTHNLGAVPSSAPSTCPDSPGHVCDVRQDLMYPFLQPLAGAALDVGRNDYYGHSGSWWDVQDSPFLHRLDVPQFPLTVAVVGPGSVASNLPGIDCPPGCSVSFRAGEQITLEPTPGEGTRFVGWSGACTGVGTCTLTVDAAKTVTARFSAQVEVGVRVARRGGSGSISVPAPGGSCSSTCTLEVAEGGRVTLRATPARGSRFLGWSGACRGLGTCTFTAAPGLVATASFGPATYRVSAAVSGRGSVRSNPVGFRCRVACAAPFRAGSTVRVLASADPGWRFAGWSGACAGPGSCRVTIEANRSVRARFVRR